MVCQCDVHEKYMYMLNCFTLGIYLVFFLCFSHSLLPSADFVNKVIKDSSTGEYRSALPEDEDSGSDFDIDWESKYDSNFYIQVTNGSDFNIAVDRETGYDSNFDINGETTCDWWSDLNIKLD